MLANVCAKMSEYFLKKKKGYIIKYYNDNYRLEPLTGVKSVTYLFCPLGSNLDEQQQKLDSYVTCPLFTAIHSWGKCNVLHNIHLKKNYCTRKGIVP